MFLGNTILSLCLPMCINGYPAFSKSASHWFNELPPLEFCPSPSGQKYIVNNDKAHGMPSDRLHKNNKLGGAFGGKMWKNAYTCGKQTRLYEKMSTVDKIDKNTFQIIIPNNSETKSSSKSCPFV